MLRRFVIVLVSLLLLGPPADAQEAGDGWIDLPGDVLQGSCSPGVVGVEELVTCRFPIAHPGDEIPQWGVRAIVSADGSADWYGNSYGSSMCHREADALVCPDLVPDWELGTQYVLLESDVTSPLAEIEVDRTSDGVLGLISIGGRLPVAFVGASTLIEVFRSYLMTDDDSASLLVRRDGSDEIVAEVPVLAAGEQEGEAQVVFPDTGRWTVTGCRVDPGGGCLHEGFRRAFQVIEPTPLPLIPGHNLVGADRISLLFVGVGWVGEREEFVEVLRQILGTDGEPLRLGEYGLVAGVDEQATFLEWGPFSIDPLRENVHKFNFWYLDADVAPGSFTIIPGPDGAWGIDLDSLGLGPHVAVVIMDRSQAYSGVAASANHPSFQPEKELPPTEEIHFGSTLMPYMFSSGEGTTTLSHELGHLIFGLADEYHRFDLDVPTLGFPNCAGSEDVAREWWGGLQGSVDPMYHRWYDREQEEGTWWGEGDRRADFVVGFVEGGCFGGESGSYRPTVDSLMNSEAPVFGAVNRRRVEEVLALWSGRAVLDLALHADRVTASCFTQPNESGAEVTCAAAIAPYLDVAGPVTVALGSDPELTATCSWDRTPSGTSVRCPSVTIPGGVDFVPVLSFGDASMSLAPVHGPGPPPTTTTTLAPAPTVPIDLESPSPDPRGLLPVLLGLASALIATGWLLRRR